ncbi:MAG: hypothetical protein DI606_08795 [Sphingobium sp.]|nr:MAG: hypothetical protein DI606_08795 [Sphingobium sp.]
MTATDPAPFDDVPENLRWIDAELSAQLAELADRGESDTAEFKRGLPEQASSLAKEIAGFATSRAGRIFLGVEDDGAIVGIEDCDTHDGRNRIRSRIEGIVKTVLPLVHVRLSFAAAGERIVAILDVPKGKQPIYYSKDIPYLRQMTATRPMTPDEVIAHVREWDKQSRPSAESRYRGDLATFLIDVDVMMADKRARRINPWAQSLRHDAGDLADRARSISATAPASLAETEPPLEKMAQALETLARERPVLSGPGAEIYGAMDEIDRLVSYIRSKWAPPETFGDDTIAQVQALVQSSAKQLAGLALRLATSDLDMSFEDVKREAGRRGMELLRCASLGVGLGAQDRVQALREIALSVRALETQPIYIDGGRSVRILIDGIRSESERLDNWLGSNSLPD